MHLSRRWHYHSQACVLLMNTHWSNQGTLCLFYECELIHLWNHIVTWPPCVSFIELLRGALVNLVALVTEVQHPRFPEWLTEASLWSSSVCHVYCWGMSRMGTIQCFFPPFVYSVNFWGQRLSSESCLPHCFSPRSIMKEMMLDLCWYTNVRTGCLHSITVIGSLSHLMLTYNLDRSVVLWLSWW